MRCMTVLLSQTKSCMIMINYRKKCQCWDGKYLTNINKFHKVFKTNVQSLQISFLTKCWNVSRYKSILSESSHLRCDNVNHINSLSNSLHYHPTVWGYFTSLHQLLSYSHVLLSCQSFDDWQSLIKSQTCPLHTLADDVQFFQTTKNAAGLLHKTIK